MYISNIFEVNVICTMKNQTKDRWKDYAAERGISVTELLKNLIEEDMRKHNFKG